MTVATWSSLRGDAARLHPTDEQIDRAARWWSGYRVRGDTFEIDGPRGVRRTVCPSCYARHTADQSVRVSIVAPTWSERRRWRKAARRDATFATACEMVERCGCPPGTWPEPPERAGHEWLGIAARARNEALRGWADGEVYRDHPGRAGG